MKIYNEMTPEEKVQHIEAYGHPYLQGTHAIGEEIRLIKHNWNTFSDYTKNLVRRVFDIKEINGEILVNM